jgi:predicted kinase
MIVMHGLSGSGKSTIAGQLLEAIGAIRIRSDVERKRLFDIRPLQQTGSSLGQGIYSAEATEATYRQLRRLAATIIDAGFSVIVDATFLLKAQRGQFIQLADEHSLTAIVIDCEAPENILRERIIKRSKGGDDASEADLGVLDRQLQTQQPLSAKEHDAIRVINCTPEGISSAQIDKIRQSLVSPHFSPG